MFVEPAPTPLQSLYFVRAVDAEGNLSAPSNFVGGPSKGAPPIGAVALDRRPPRIQAPPRVRTSSDPGACSAWVPTLGQPVVTDNVGIASVTNDAPADYRFPVGRTEVIWTATDPSAYRSTARQVVRVTDDEPPGISALRLDQPLLPPRKPELTWIQANLSYTLTDNCSPASALRVKLHVDRSGAHSHARDRDEWKEHPESWEAAGPLRVWFGDDKERWRFDTFYTITLRVRDEAGNASARSLSVKVPKWTRGG
jgi:hypothetical protein